MTRHPRRNQPPAPECAGTSVKHWTGDIRYKSLAMVETKVLDVAIASKYLISSSRPWECGNPEGISKECGKGGKSALWLSMLSILCHFHALFFARCWINRYAAN